MTQSSVGYFVLVRGFLQFGVLAALTTCFSTFKPL